MFRVKLTSECLGKFVYEKRKQKFKREEIDNIHAWILEMREFGPTYIKNSIYWRDHALTGNRFGQRASSFSDSGRIIYKHLKKEKLIIVLDITPDHRY